MWQSKWTSKKTQFNWNHFCQQCKWVDEGETRPKKNQSNQSRAEGWLAMDDQQQGPQSADEGQQRMNASHWFHSVSSWVYEDQRCVADNQSLQNKDTTSLNTCNR